MPAHERSGPSWTDMRWLDNLMTCRPISGYHWHPPGSQRFQASSMGGTEYSLDDGFSTSSNGHWRQDSPNTRSCLFVLPEDVDNAYRVFHEHKVTRNFWSTPAWGRTCRSYPLKAWWFDVTMDWLTDGRHAVKDKYSYNSSRLLTNSPSVSRQVGSCQ